MLTPLPTWRRPRLTRRHGLRALATAAALPGLAARALRGTRTAWTHEYPDGANEAPGTAVAPAPVEIERLDGYLEVRFPEGLAAMAATARGDTLALAHNWSLPSYAVNVAQLGLLEPSTGRLRGTVAFRDDANCCGWPPVAVASAGDTLLLGADRPRAYRLDGAPVAAWPFQEPGEAAAALAISAGGDRAAAVTSRNRLLLVWGLDNPALAGSAAADRPELLARPLGWSGSSDLALSADGATLPVAGGRRAQLLTWQGRDAPMAEERRLDYTASWAAAAIAADGALYATAGASGDERVRVTLFERSQPAPLAIWHLDDVRLPRLTLAGSPAGDPEAAEVVVDNAFGGPAAILLAGGRPSLVERPAAGRGLDALVHVARDAAGRTAWLRGREITLWPAGMERALDGAAPAWRAEAPGAIQQLLLAGNSLYALGNDGESAVLTNRLWAWPLGALSPAAAAAAYA